jgi:hypothetical protein
VQMTRRVNIENISCFLFVPVSSLLVVVFGFLLEQDPALNMPPGHDSDTDSKYHIFKSIAFSQQRSVLNFIVGVQTRFDIPLSQVWRSVCVRLSGLVTEILLGSDVNSHNFLNWTHFYVTFCAFISGSAMVGVYCSNILLVNYSVVLPSDPPPGLRQTFYGDAWLANVCLSRRSIQIFIDRIISPLSIRGWKSTIVSHDFQPNQAKAIHLIAPV